jgi:hypothetical protein
MLRRVALVITSVSEDLIASPILITLIMEAMLSSETVVHNIPQDGNLYIYNLCKHCVVRRNICTVANIMENKCKTNHRYGIEEAVQS